jgi:hypothetical protein
MYRLAKYYGAPNAKALARMAIYNPGEAMRMLERTPYDARGRKAYPGGIAGQIARAQDWQEETGGYDQYTIGGLMKTAKQGKQQDIFGVLLPKSPIK